MAHGFYTDDADDDDEYLDTCLGCGGTTWAHRGVRTWDQATEGCIAPQLCPRCWQSQGYPWPAYRPEGG